jgi:Short C-terminal domain
MFGHLNLLKDGAQIDGVVLDAKPAPMVRTKTRVSVGVKFDDGETAEFEQDITDYYVAAGEGFKGVLAAAGGADVIPLSFVTGSAIPVRYNPDQRDKLVIDEPALHERALQHWTAGKQAERSRAEEVLARGPSAVDGDDEEHELADDELSGAFAGSADPTTRLQQLAELHRSGDLSDEEFAAAKRQVLGA